MIGMTVTGQYFNPRFVIAASRKAGRRVLSRQGAYVRGIAKRKIRKAPKKRTRDSQGRFKSGGKRLSSSPGHPPYTHTGALKKSIVFAVGEDSVIIGPSHSEIGRIGHTHEFGGIEAAVRSKGRTQNLRIGCYATIRTRQGREVFIKLKTKRQIEAARKLAREKGARKILKPRRRYPKRQFMEPALADSKEALPKMWANSIRKSA